jgi:outer membrane protein insertion porin family
VKKDGLSFTFSRPISNVLTSSLRIESEDVIPSVTGSYLKRSFRFLVSYDSRDNWLDTKRGIFASLSVEQAFKSLGSTIEYSRYDSDLFYFTPFRDRATIAFRITAGILKPILESGVYLPVSENYQIGGSTTVRGYPDTTPFAVGQRQILGSIEYRQNLSQLIGVVVFFDWGTAFESRIELSDIKIGKGAGLRINTPMGPIRGDFGWGEAGLMVFHFTLGQAF